MKRTLVTFIVSSLLAVASAGASPRSSGTVALTTTSLPGQGPGLVKVVRKATAARAVFYAQGDEWTVHYAVLLAKPLRSSELSLTISDISRAKQYVTTRYKIVNTDARYARGTFTLKRDDVQSPNAKLLLEIENSGVKVAQRVFFIQGKTEKRGKTTIQFSESEANVEDDGLDGMVASKRRRRS